MEIKMDEMNIIDENSKPKDKLKAWYLFTEDFIAGTQHLTNEQIGIYIRLLCWNWNKRCSGILNNENTYFRIGNCITDSEKESCKQVLDQFFVLVGHHYQNERQLQEYLFITRRIEASKKNGLLGGRPKKPSTQPRTNPPTTTPTNTSNSTIRNNVSQYNYDTILFNRFWAIVKYKVSKGTALKNFRALEKNWKNDAEELAILYNKYYDSLEDKKFAKHPAFWLSAEKYLDEPIKSNEKIDENEFYTQKFLEVINNKKRNTAISKVAQNRSEIVKRAIQENKFSKQDAIDYLDMGQWL